MTIIYNYFDIEYGQHEYHTKRELDKGKTPLISSKGKDRGIYGYFNIEPKYKGVISVPNTGSICEAFYQGEDCCIDDNCLVLIPKKEMNIKEIFYFVTIIRMEGYKYLYGRQVTPEKLGNTKIPDKIPSWVYKIKVNDYSNISNPKIKKEIEFNNNWKDIRVDTLFDVKGTKTTPLKILEKKGNGEYPYITTQSMNNGVGGFYNLYTDEGNILTIDSAVLGYCSYQSSNFSASDHVEKLIPQFKMNVYIALFLTTIINKEQYRYSYGRKFNQDRIKNTIIKLPFKNGEPDWEFMEDYIKSLPYSSSL